MRVGLRGGSAGREEGVSRRQGHVAEDARQSKNTAGEERDGRIDGQESWSRKGGADEQRHAHTAEKERRRKRGRGKEADRQTDYRY